MVNLNLKKNMNLQLSLKKKWFEMTKAGIKTEDYREINEYWVKRFLYHKESKLTIEEIIRYIKNYKYYGYVDVSAIFTYHDLSFKEFYQNVMTLGYPKSTDTERILRLEHKGIEIRTGNPDWGAEPNKLYFVIKHGEIMENKLETCHHCGKQKENCYHGFIALTIPHPEWEAKIEKWGRKNWWENLERTDLTPEQVKELDDICSYDQALNTVGRGVQCDDCGRREAELYEKYYPRVGE